MKILLIDDVREPQFITDPNSSYYDSFNPTAVSIARTAEEGITLLASHNYDILLLDHDMGTEWGTYTGMHVIRYLDGARDKLPKKIYLVTSNTVMAPLMLEYCKRWKDEGFIEECKWLT